MSIDAQPDVINRESITPNLDVDGHYARLKIPNSASSREVADAGKARWLELKAYERTLAKGKHMSVTAHWKLDTQKKELDSSIFVLTRKRDLYDTGCVIFHVLSGLLKTGHTSVEDLVLAIRMNVQMIASKQKQKYHLARPEKDSRGRTSYFALPVCVECKQQQSNPLCHRVHSSIGIIFRSFSFKNVTGCLCRSCFPKVTLRAALITGTLGWLHWYSPFDVPIKFIRNMFGELDVNTQDHLCWMAALTSLECGFPERSLTLYQEAEQSEHAAIQKSSARMVEILTGLGVRSAYLPGRSDHCWLAFVQLLIFVPIPLLFYWLFWLGGMAMFAN
ncbi:MAG: hypothetical protein JKY49_13075 [Cohaesibacteraceae bacterium]|nr:hypothetical protein [Cohaesibacteraceae bacterium]